jgi:hypothetical protein
LDKLNNKIQLYLEITNNNKKMVDFLEVKKILVKDLKDKVLCLEAAKHKIIYKPRALILV